MLKRLYSWLYNVTARRDEKGEYSGGIIQGAIRDAVLKLCLGSRGRALEIGTGVGLFLLRLANQNPLLEIWGVDMDEEFLDASAKKIVKDRLDNVHLVHQNAEKMSFDDDYFDIVICINLFLDIDIKSVARALKEMKRVVKPSGRIIFEFRNCHNMLFRLKYKLARYYDPSAPYPLYTHDPSTIDDIIKEIGMKVIDRKYLGFPVKRFAPIIIVETRKIL